MVLLYTGFKEEGFNRAELFAEEKPGDNEIRFSMLLDFTLLGQLEVHVALIDSSISIGISADSQDRADFITENLPLLEKVLKGNGITTGDIDCKVRDGDSRITNPYMRGNEPSVHIVI